jgi:hypothetical protein
VAYADAAAGLTTGCTEIRQVARLTPEQECALGAGARITRLRRISAYSP